MSMTIKFCPICGTEHIKVVFEGNFSYTRLGRFAVQCSNGHGSDVYWPNEDHDEDCECDLHECEGCGNISRDLKDTGADGVLCGDCIISLKH